MSEVQKESLNSFAQIFSSTPFESPLRQAIDALVRGELKSEYFKTIAGARLSLTGAIYDAQLNLLEDAGFGKWTAPQETPPAQPESPLLESCLEFLTEMAINGFDSLENEQLQPFSQTLDNLLKNPQYNRQSSLLIGFINELSQSIPIHSMSSVPLRRWADMWSRAVINSTCVVENGKDETISGELFILGTDINQHSNCVSLKCHGIVQNETENRFVNLTITTYKVDTIVGPECWNLFKDYSDLVTALSENKSLQISELPIVSDNALLWDETKVELLNAFSPLEVAKEHLAEAVQYKVPSFDRHYVHICAPVFLEGYKVKVADGEHRIVADGFEMNVDKSRMSSMSLLTPAMIKTSLSCFGFMRFDGVNWTFQVLTVNTVVKKKEYVVHNATNCGSTVPPAIKKKKKANDSFSILKERSSRLLRK
ncbi:hypothetical protein [Fulvitalea axinellae]|uniref:hypothetical protein n=1 Tax=Fulvitalea axinellae TaxID=1182444 RepID=UPI0030CA2286